MNPKAGLLFMQFHRSLQHVLTHLGSLTVIPFRGLRIEPHTQCFSSIQYMKHAPQASVWLGGLSG